MLCALCFVKLTVRIFTPNGVICATCYQREVMRTVPTIPIPPPK